MTKSQVNRAIVSEYFAALNKSRPDEAADIVKSCVSADIEWRGPQPFNDLDGVDALIETYWNPLLSAFPDLRRRCDLLLTGDYGGREWVSASGYFHGSFQRDWIGIPATGEPTLIRFGEIMALEDGKIFKTHLLLDLLDVMQQGGFRLGLPTPATEGLRPGVKNGSGVLASPQDPAETRKTLLLVEAMLFGLVRKDQPMARYWHSQMMWNSPSGVGTARSRKEFNEAVHEEFQGGLTGQWDGSHNARYAEGRFAVSTGWPSLVARHEGPFPGIPPTGNLLRWRIMDFWEREDDYLIRSWVHIDMINIFEQLGVDVFGRLRAGAGPSQKERQSRWIMTQATKVPPAPQASRSRSPLAPASCHATSRYRSRAELQLSASQSGAER